MLKLTYSIKNIDIKRNVENFMQQHFSVEKDIEDGDEKQPFINLFFIEVNNEQAMKHIAILVEKLKKDAIAYELVFISNVDTMVFKLLVFKPFYFLRESVLEADLQTLKTIIQQNLMMNTIIIVKSGNAMVRLNVDNILFIESFGHYLIIHTSYARYKIRDKISSFHSELKKTSFIRTHKSYIVNLDFVDKIYNDYMTLVGMRDQIPISRKFRKSVIDRFNCLPTY